jgi:hypothetical protein
MFQKNHKNLNILLGIVSNIILIVPFFVVGIIVQIYNLFCLIGPDRVDGLYIIMLFRALRGHKY